MGISDFLPHTFKKKEVSANTSFLALTLLPANVLAYVWRISDSQTIKQEGYNEKKIKEAENIIHETAAAIDDAAQNTKGDLEKVVFGLSLSYFDGDNLKPETSKLLKDIADNLELSAQAFISLPSAINHQQKAQDSITPHAVLVGVFEEFCEISLIEKNKVQKSKTFAQNADLEILTSAIRNLKTENTLPSKIIVYGLPENDKFAQSIIKHDWSELFIHAPKITFLKNEELAKSIAYSQAADILGHDVKSNQKTEIDEAPKPAIANKPDGFGFIEGEDILKIAKENPPNEEVLEDVQPDFQSETANEITAVNAIEPEANVVSPHQILTSEQHSENEREATAVEEYNPPTKAHKKSFVSKFRQELFTLSWLSNFGNVFQATSKRNLFLGAAIIVVAVFVGIFTFGQFFSRLEAIIKVNAKSQDTDFKIIAVAGGQLDLQKQQIPGEQLTETAQSKQSTTTTGIKKIGQNAGGEITVFNWTTSPKTFSKNTSVISKSGVKFSLTSDVDVASRSASTPGQSKVNVKATNTGDSGNLTGGNDFTFQEYDELLFSAHNDNPMTGGSEKQITVVSQDDLTKLEKSTTSALTDQLKATLKSKYPDKKLEDDAIAIKVVSRNFDKKLDEEATILNLDITLEASTVAYNPDDLKAAIAQSASDSSNNLQANPQDAEIINSSAKLTNNTLTLTGKGRVKLVPKLNVDDLKQKIAGKGAKEARSTILQNSDFTDVEFKFSPNIPIFGSIPKNPDKITITLLAN